jgi:DNA invertase Pin-like site-specific DNA recombinase
VPERCSPRCGVDHGRAWRSAVGDQGSFSYARASTSGRLLDHQQRALAEASCLRVFADKLSGKNADRPELVACLDYLRPGDTLASYQG